MVTRTVYVCTGSCHGVATLLAWKRGAKTCGAKNCEKHGKPLLKRKQCTLCKEFFMLGKRHRCKK